jgi:hypothetical protein
MEGKPYPIIQGTLAAKGSPPLPPDFRSFSREESNRDLRSTAGHESGQKWRYFFLSGRRSGLFVGSSEGL